MANSIQQLPVIQWEPPKPVYTPKTTPVVTAAPAPKFWEGVNWWGLISVLLMFTAGPTVRYMMQQTSSQPAPYTQVK